MGLGKKLGQLNKATDQQLASAALPVAEGGFNKMNLSTLPPSAPLTAKDISDISQVASEAHSDYVGKEHNTSGLVKPTVPTGTQYPNYEINKLVVEKMWRIICLKRLHAFYTQEQLQTLVNRACRHDYVALMKMYNLPTIDMTVDLSVLGLYDIVLLADDSGSMDTFEKKEEMTRYELLKEVLKTIGFWASLLDADGVVLRFLNSNMEGNGLSSSKEVDDIIKKVSPSGCTPTGESIETKILDKMVLPFLKSGELGRPVLVITITDGFPYRQYTDDKDANIKIAKQRVVDAILRCKNECTKSKYGENAMAFSFAQVGSDVEATEYLGEIDTHKDVGHLIDCTSEFSIEQKECGPEFTEAVWVVKLMIGAVDPAYDAADEGGTVSSSMTSLPPPPSYAASVASTYTSATAPPSYAASTTYDPYKSSLYPSGGYK